jgi:hypothetical protein
MSLGPSSSPAPAITICRRGVDGVEDSVRVLPGGTEEKVDVAGEARMPVKSYGVPANDDRGASFGGCQSNEHRVRRSPLQERCSKPA